MASKLEAIFAIIPFYVGNFLLFYTAKLSPHPHVREAFGLIN